MNIAPLEAEHLDAVEAIESNDGDVRWSRKQFQDELAGEFKRFFVAMESDAGILGYAGYWKAGPEAQITNLVVKSSARCQGVGKRLIEFLLDCARSEGCETCTLEVRKSNVHAQKLYQGLGFEMKGERKKIYENPEEDALLMEKTL